VAKVLLENVSLNFPELAINERSLRKYFFRLIMRPDDGTQDLGKKFEAGLRGVSLKVEPGERLAVLGPNGAGKTTLLRTILGAYPINSGSMLVQGSLSGVTDLFLGLNFDDSGIDNIELRARIAGLTKKQFRQLVPSIIEFSGLGQEILRPMKTYSSGMQLRLAFSISTALRADIVVLDEWMAVGDQEFAAKAEGRLLELVDDAKILILATHSRELAERLCTRGIILNQGRVSFDGEIRQATALHFDK